MNRGDRNRRTKKDRREIGRIKRSLGALSNTLGRISEEYAQEICSKLKEEGTIKYFWPIVSQSTLDRRGIDIICQTDRGFFFLNIKKSYLGAKMFSNRREEMKAAGINVFDIYPWRVIPELSERHAAERELFGILTANPPSAEVLTPKIKAELDDPTFFVKRDKDNTESSEEKSAEEEISLDGKRKKVNKALKGHRGLTDFHVSFRNIKEAKLIISINHRPLEIVRHATKMAKAEEAAYQALLDVLKEKNML